MLPEEPPQSKLWYASDIAYDMVALNFSMILAGTELDRIISEYKHDPQFAINMTFEPTTFLIYGLSKTKLVTLHRRTPFLGEEVRARK